MADQKQKSISINDFKMWLEGVEEMQPEDWVPNEHQWKLIRAKLALVDGAPKAPQVATMPPNMAMVFPPLDTSPPAPPGAGSAVPVPSNLNVVTAPRPASRPATTPAGLPVMLATGQTDAPVKTPNIDTSGGKGYGTPFA